MKQKPIVICCSMGDAGRFNNARALQSTVESRATCDVHTAKLPLESTCSSIKLPKHPRASTSRDFIRGSLLVTGPFIFFSMSCPFSSARNLGQNVPFSLSTWQRLTSLSVSIQIHTFTLSSSLPLNAGMRVRSCLPACTFTAHDSVISPPEIPKSFPKLFSSDTSNSPEMSGSLSTSGEASCSSSLHSSLSLQTLPSVPSLQNLSSEALNLSVSHLCVATLKPRPVHISCLAVSADSLYAASGNHIHVFDLKNYAHFDTFNIDDSSSGSVKSVAFCDGKIFTSHQNGRIRVWQMTLSKRHRLVATLPTVNDRLRHFMLPKNYVSVRRHKKRLWIEHADAVSGLSVSDGFICSVSWDKCFKIWRTSDLRCLESVKAHQDAVNAVAISDNGTIYTGSADGRIKVWAKASGEKGHTLVATLEKHKSAVNALALNGDGSILFSGACDRSILVWEREDSANHMVVTGALRGHRKAILCLISVSDLLLSGSADRTVRIWQSGNDGRYCCLSVLEGHEKPVKALVAVPDDESKTAGAIRVFSGSLDGEIKVWQVSVSSQNGPLTQIFLKRNNFIK